MQEENKTTPVEKSAQAYEECTESIGLRRCKGEFYDNEKKVNVSYVSYYLTIGEDIRIKISLDSEKKALMTKYLPFIPVVEEVGVE